MRMTIGLFTLALCTAACSGQSPRQEQQADAGRPSSTPQPDLGANNPALVRLMDKIEAKVTLPPGSNPLAAYSRFYAWVDGTHAKVHAIYVSDTSPGRKWTTTDSLPVVLDGGCSIIELNYGVASDRVEWVVCNGEA